MEIRGRFAPSPSGRMHLGNLFSALLAWLDVRSRGGVMLLRIEDLDPDRCSREKAEVLLDDLRWLGLDWDEGGLEPAYMQSCRGEHYRAEFEKLRAMDLVYPCWCTRSQRLAASAPHRGEAGESGACPCARLTAAERAARTALRAPAWRVRVPDETMEVADGHMGPCRENLRRDCGDYLIRRSDGVWAYQLAVVADDAAMGVTRVVRGCDLLSSAPRQAWLHRTLGYEPPEFFHVPLLVDGAGRRLSKRDGDLDMGALRQRYRPEELLGLLGWLSGLLDRPEPILPYELAGIFHWAKVPRDDIVIDKLR